MAVFGITLSKFGPDFYYTFKPLFLAAFSKYYHFNLILLVSGGQTCGFGWEGTHVVFVQIAEVTILPYPQIIVGYAWATVI